MTELIRRAGSFYHFLFTDLADPRTMDLPLMAGPLPGLAILGFYLYFVMNLGPQLMRDRKPMQLKPLLAVFNVFQIASSFFVFYKSLDLGWGIGRKFKFFCQPVDFSYDPEALEIAWYAWLYMIFKFIDLLDTVFIVLRKNQHQVSFLHVYHHTGVAMVLWSAVKYYPGGHGSFLAVVNSFVHGVMYSYYLLTTIAPGYKQNIWWKKYITQMQMTQFVILGLHAISVILIPGCEYQCKYIYAAVMVPQNFFMFMLFYNFYCHAYSSEKMQRAQAKMDEAKLANGKAKAT